MGLTHNIFRYVSMPSFLRLFEICLGVIDRHNESPQYANILLSILFFFSIGLPHLDGFSSFKNFQFFRVFQIFCQTLLDSSKCSNYDGHNCHIDFPFLSLILLWSSYLSSFSFSFNWNLSSARAANYSIFIIQIWYSDLDWTICSNLKVPRECCVWFFMTDSLFGFCMYHWFTWSIMQFPVDHPPQIFDIYIYIYRERERERERKRKINDVSNK